jgi:2-dehydro-3-deoxyphosphogluconate aldolase/(4S)-4-hydroxy-2-oxoglutarate aldolase
MGCTLLKFFPAEALGGVKVLKAYAPVFSEVRFVPTGGIGAENLRSYLKLPNVLACGGSWLLEGSLGEIRAKLQDLRNLRLRAPG